MQNSRTQEQNTLSVTRQINEYFSGFIWDYIPMLFVAHSALMPSIARKVPTTGISAEICAANSLVASIAFAITVSERLF